MIFCTQNVHEIDIFHVQEVETINKCINIYIYTYKYDVISDSDIVYLNKR